MHSNKIQKFTAEGVSIFNWGGTEGTGDGQFSYPHGVAMASDGSVYVVAQGSTSIRQFAPEGVFVRKWGTEGTGGGQLKSPRGVAVAPDGSVYVADPNNYRIQKFSVGP